MLNEKLKEIYDICYCKNDTFEITGFEVDKTKMMLYSVTNINLISELIKSFNKTFYLTHRHRIEEMDKEVRIFFITKFQESQEQNKELFEVDEDNYFYPFKHFLRYVLNLSYPEPDNENTTDNHANKFHVQSLMLCRIMVGYFVVEDSWQDEKILMTIQNSLNELIFELNRYNKGNIESIAVRVLQLSTGTDTVSGVRDVNMAFDTLLNKLKESKINLYQFVLQVNEECGVRVGKEIQIMYDTEGLADALRLYHGL